MRKLIKSLKWMVIPSALMLLLLSMGVVNAGGRWSGIDPVLTVNGEDTINIWVEWLEEDTCSIEGAIKIDVSYPKDADVVLVGESAEGFVCEDGSTTKIETSTKLKASKKMDDELKVVGKLKGPNKFPFVVKVYKNGELVSTCEGLSNGGKKSKGKKAVCDHISY